MDFFPQQEGLLPYFLLYTCVAAFAHALVCYIRPIPAIKQFSGDNAPVPHQLLAHVYGIKNCYTALIRAYAAYNTHSTIIYDLAMATFVGVLMLYVPEYFVWRTVDRRAVIFPFVTSGTALVWMYMQRDWYTSQT